MVTKGMSICIILLFVPLLLSQSPIDGTLTENPLMADPSKDPASQDGMIERTAGPLGEMIVTIDGMDTLWLSDIVEKVVITGSSIIDDLQLTNLNEVEFRDVQIDGNEGTFDLRDCRNVSFSNATITNANIKLDCELCDIFDSNFVRDSIEVDCELCDIFDSNFVRDSIEVCSWSGSEYSNSTYENTTLVVEFSSGVPIHHNKFIDSQLNMIRYSDLNISYNLFLGTNITHPYLNEPSLYLNNDEYTGNFNKIYYNIFESCYLCIFPYDPFSWDTYFYNFEIWGNYFGNCTDTLVIWSYTYVKDLRVWRNTFYHNAGTGDSGGTPQVSMAMTPRGNIWFFSDDGIGNCWWNYRSPDNDSDNIVDVPLDLKNRYNMNDDTYKVFDRYPLTDRFEVLFRPHIEILSPKPGDYCYRDMVVKWNVSNLRYKITLTEIKIDEGDWINVSDTTSKKLNFERGVHRLTLRALNEVGLWNSTYVEVENRYDPFLLVINEPSDGSYVTEDPVHLSWSIADAFPLGSMELKVGGSTYFPELGSREMDLALSEGVYKLKLTITDIANLSLDKEISFAVDRTLPQIILEGLKDGDIISNLNVALNWSVQENFALKSINYSIDDGEIIDIVGSQHGSLTFQTSYGDHKFTLSAADMALHRSERTVRFTVSEGAGELIMMPPEGFQTNSDQVRFVWTPPDWMEVTVTRVTNANELSIQNITGANTALVPLDRDGSATIWVDFYNEQGNRYRQTRTVVRDTKRPLLLVPEEVIFFNTGEPILSWSAFDETEIGHFELMLDDEGWVDNGLKSSFSLRALADGEHQFHVKVFDVAGNMNEGSFGFIIDTMMPTLQVTGVEKGDVLTSPIMDLYWTSQDKNGIGQVLIILDGTSITAASTGSLQKGLDPGPHELIVVVRDNAGNEFEHKDLFHVDLMDPTVEWWTVPDPFISLSTALLRWKTYDDTAIAMTELEIDGVTTQLPHQANGTQVFLSEGCHLLVLTVKDLAGRTASTSCFTFVDMTAPDFGPISASWTGETWLMTFEVWDNQSGLAEVIVEIDGVVVWTGDGATSIDLGPIARTMYNVIISLTDRSGNRNIKAGTIRIGPMEEEREDKEGISVLSLLSIGALSFLIIVGTIVLVFALTRRLVLKEQRKTRFSERVHNVSEKYHIDELEEHR